MIIIINSYTYYSSLYICCYIGPAGLPREQIYIRNTRAYTVVIQRSRNKLIRLKEILLQQNHLKYKKLYKRELTAHFLYSPRGRIILSKSINSSILYTIDSSYYSQHAYKPSRPLRTPSSPLVRLYFPLTYIYSAIISYYLYNYQYLRKSTRPSGTLLFRVPFTLVVLLLYILNLLVSPPILPRLQ